jgi:hypothetical protein
MSDRNLAFTRDHSGRGNERTVMADPFVNYVVVKGSRQPVHQESYDNGWVHREKMKSQNMNTNYWKKRYTTQGMSNGNKFEYRSANAHDTRGYVTG